MKEWYQRDFWGTHIHPDDREAALEFCQKSSQSCQEYEFDYRMIASDGSAIWIHDLVTVDRVGGSPKTLRGFMMDITARKQSEEALRESESRLRLLADTSPAYVSYVDHQQRFQFNNAAYEELVGLPRQKMEGRFMSEILGEKAYAAIRGYVEKALAGQKVAWEEDVLFPDGTTRRLMGSYRPHYGEDGHPYSSR